ncbi:MAG: hypothetical protein SGILL_008612 [Bacillariaceae sp.]
MYRLTKSLENFFEQNERQPQHIRQSVTTKLVVVKGLAAKHKLLELDEAQPFLNPLERKALVKFTGSDSWAKKFAKRHGLKMSGARMKELSSKEATMYHDSLKDMALRVKVAGPRYEEVAILIRKAAEKLQLIQSGKKANDASCGRNRQKPRSRGKVLSKKTKATGEKVTMDCKNKMSRESNQQQQETHGQQVQQIEHLTEQQNEMPHQRRQQQGHSNDQGNQQLQIHPLHFEQQQSTHEQQHHVEDPLRIMYSTNDRSGTATHSTLNPVMGRTAPQQIELPEDFQPI